MRILIADSDELVSKLISNLLKESNPSYECISSQNLSEAVKAYPSFSCDRVIMAATFPKSDNDFVEICSSIVEFKNKFPESKLIIFSGYDREYIIELLSNYSVFLGPSLVYLPKPSSLDGIVGAINSFYC